jgi:hypothetical protein
MKATRSYIIILMAVFISGSMFAVGCAGKTGPKAIETIMGQEMDGAPDWVKGKGCASNKNGKAICSVGSIGGTRNVSLAREAAIERARVQMARSLQDKVMAMLKNYQATTTGGQEFGTSASDEQHVRDVSKTITDMNLSGTEIIDSWVSNTGTYYALVALDVDKFKDTVNKIQSLSESVRKAVIERADKAFSELDSEIDKQESK